ncbi:MAG: hypothetical protein ACPLRX_05370 [Candidatus Saccharicenans sp.]
MPHEKIYVKLFYLLVVELRTVIKNRVHGLLDKLGVKHPFDNLFTGGLKFIKSLQLRNNNSPHFLRIGGEA